MDTKNTTKNWVFSGHDERRQPITLYQIGNTTFKKHKMIALKQPNNPFLLEDATDFSRRSKSQVLHSVILDNRKKTVILKQNGVCGWCECPMEAYDSIQLHHVIPFKDGGTSKLNNLMAVHAECHKDKL